MTNLIYGFKGPLVNSENLRILEKNMGIAGSQGIQGAQGIQGSGLQGIQGSSGIQGNQGIQGGGLQGTQGTIGIQGLAGSQGLQGIQGGGLQGTQGTIGIQGLAGSQGLQGIQGSTGSVSTSYVDGSLSLRDVSISWLNSYRIIQDASMISSTNVDFIISISSSDYTALSPKNSTTLYLIIG